MEWLAKLVDLLGRLGFNTTRLKWRLFNLEKRMKTRGLAPRLPVSLHWLKYPHKHCLQCGALVDRAARTCPSCGRRAPSLVAYRLYRLFGIISPPGAPLTVSVFLCVSLLLFGLSIAMQGFSALMGPTNLTLNIFGAWNGLLAIHHGQYWRYLSFGVMHIGVLHIGFNLFALLQVGPVVEERIGPLRMLVLITFTQITSALASQIWYVGFHHSLTATTAGASGWLFGLIGYGIAHLRGQIGAAKGYRDTLVQWAIYALIFGWFIGANNAAHLGGLLGGIALGSLPAARRQFAEYTNRAWHTAAAVCLVLWLVTAGYLTVSIATHWRAGTSQFRQYELMDKQGDAEAAPFLRRPGPNQESVR